MAIFSTKKTKTVSASKSATKNVSNRKPRESTNAIRARAAVVLKAPWISEKSLIGTDKGVYVFSIPRDATKKDVMRAIETVYKVVPRKVCTANLPGKRVSHRTRAGVAIRPRRRKAYVYLQEGDTIQFA